MRPQPSLLSLTRRAVRTFQDLVARERLSPEAMLRVEVDTSPGGYRYRLFLDEVCDVDDMVLDVQGVPVALGRAAADLLEGAVIDFQEDGLGGRGFRVDNPNEPEESAASDPGLLRLSRRKLRELHPELARDRLSLDETQDVRRLANHLRRGDSRAAVVLSILPLLVAAYTDELDCVAVLRFPAELGGDFKLRKGSRLLAVNLYGTSPPGTDLTPGPDDTGRYSNFAPLIADFLSDDEVRIMFRKRAIHEAEWERCLGLGKEYIARHGRVGRDGSPLACWRPAF